MRTNLDALRSLKRYVALALPDPYEVVLAGDEASQSRPYASVKATGPALITGPAHTVDVAQPFAVYAYPMPADTPADSLVVAARIEEALNTAFALGIDKGRRMRLPLYDFEGLGMDERSEVRTPHDFARIMSLSVNRVQTPDDERFFTVTAELRLAWRRGTPVRDTPLVREVRTDIEHA